MVVVVMLAVMVAVMGMVRVRVKAMAMAVVTSHYDALAGGRSRQSTVCRLPSLPSIVYRLPSAVCSLPTAARDYTGWAGRVGSVLADAVGSKCRLRSVD